VVGELKWRHEFETKNRTVADYAWFNLLMNS
jgi:hypothetical protein